jgi:hypothetical protein
MAFFFALRLSRRVFLLSAREFQLHIALILGVLLAP